MQFNEQHLVALIELLLEKFPNKLPTGLPSTEEVYRLIGQQDVISFLIGELERSQS